MIYADNAATTKLDLYVFEAMKPFLLEEYSNPSQAYSFSRKNRKAIKKAREIIATCINARPEEIYFTSGGTESDNWAIKGCVDINSERREVITSTIEHHAILNSCSSIERLGFNISYLSSSKDGVIDANELKSVISEQTKLVSVMLANNEIGTIQDIKKLSKIAHENGALFHTDAVQALGHIKVDVQDLGVEMLSASAHKFNGPKGIGFMYLKNGTEIFPYIDGGYQEKGYRAGTENIASIVGMAVALKKNCDVIEKNIKYLRELEEMLLSSLSNAGIDYIHNGGNNRIPGNVNISICDTDGELILHRLDLMGIYVSTGSACDGQSTKISHVIKAINVPEEYAKGTIRISLGYDNTKEEVEKIADSIIRILGK